MREADWWWPYWRCWSPQCTDRVPAALDEFRLTWDLLTVLIGIVTLTATILYSGNIQQSMLIEHTTQPYISMDELVASIVDRQQQPVFFAVNDSAELQMWSDARLARMMKQSPPVYATAASEFIDKVMNDNGIAILPRMYLDNVVSKMTDEQCDQIEMLRFEHLLNAVATVMLRKHSPFTERLSFHVAERFGHIHYCVLRFQAMNGTIFRIILL